MLYALDSGAVHKNFHDKLTETLILWFDSVVHETQKKFFCRYTVFSNKAKADANIPYIPQHLLSDK